MTSRQPAERSITPSWDAIFQSYEIDQHDFDAGPFIITSAEIGAACQNFARPGQKEARILCKQDTRASRPRVFRDNGLFILPVTNGSYAIIRGEGYVDVPPIVSRVQEYRSDFPFELTTTKVGDSEMQHLDRAYALSLLRHFADDASLVLTIRGRKFTPTFNFVTGEFHISVDGVQTEVDAGYEGENRVVLVEAKSGKAANPESTDRHRLGRKMGTEGRRTGRSGDFLGW